MKFLFYLSLILIGLNLSCTNDESVSEIDSEKVNYVLNAKDPEISKTAYLLLNPDEMYFIWNERLQNILDNEELNNAQISFISELKSDLSPNAFEQDSQENNNLKLKYSDEKFIDFDGFQATYYFATLLNVQAYGSFAQLTDFEKVDRLYFGRDGYYLSDNKGKKSSCTCHKGSMVNPYCDYDCPVIEHTKRGCGWLFWYSCNGKHLPF